MRMDLRTYLKDKPRGEAERIALLAETTVDYIYQLSGGHRTPSLKLAKRLEEATEGIVGRSDWPMQDEDSPA